MLPQCPLGRDRRGATAVEFAILLPLLAVAVFGGFDILHQIYARAALEGAVERAARDATLERNSLDPRAVDEAVARAFGTGVPNATLSFARTAYSGFGRVAQPERFTDTDGDGVREPGECFIDQNGNGTWDADPGVQGNGTGNDVVRYRVTARWRALFPAWRLLGRPETQSVTVETRMRNQPFVSPVDRDQHRCD